MELSIIIMCGVNLVVSLVILHGITTMPLKIGADKTLLPKSIPRPKKTMAKFKPKAIDDNQAYRQELAEQRDRGPIY